MIQKPTLLTEQEMGEFIEKVPWVFAHSYSDTFPHRYTTRDRVADDHLFNCFVLTMRERSKIKAFFSKQYLYYERDDYEFWEMGRPIFCVPVINRAPIADNATYRMRKPEPVDRDILLNKLKQRDDYLYDLLQVQNPTETQRLQLEYLMNPMRGNPNPNVISHANQPIRYQ